MAYIYGRVADNKCFRSQILDVDANDPSCDVCVCVSDAFLSTPNVYAAKY